MKKPYSAPLTSPGQRDERGEPAGQQQRVLCVVPALGVGRRQLRRGQRQRQGLGEGQRHPQRWVKDDGFKECWGMDKSEWGVMV